MGNAGAKGAKGSKDEFTFDETDGAQQAAVAARARPKPRACSLGAL